MDKKRESPSLEILERVRALTLAGQQRAAAGGFEGLVFRGQGMGLQDAPASHCRPLRCRVPDAVESVHALWTWRRAACGAARALPPSLLCLWRHGLS